MAPPVSPTGWPPCLPQKRQPKGNPYLRAALGQMATGAAKTDTFLGQRYRRLCRRMLKAKALGAVERSILVIIFHLLADPTATFEDLGADYYEKRGNKERRTRSLVQQLEDLRPPSHSHRRRLANLLTLPQPVRATTRAGLRPPPGGPDRRVYSTVVIFWSGLAQQVLLGDRRRVDRRSALGDSRIVGQTVPEKGASVRRPEEVAVDLAGDLTLQAAGVCSPLPGPISPPEQRRRLTGTMAGSRRQRAEHAGQKRLFFDIRACPIDSAKVGRDHKEPGQQAQVRKGLKMKSCRLSLPLPLCSRRHPAAGLSRREPSAALSPVRVRTTRAARLRSCFFVAAVAPHGRRLIGAPGRADRVRAGCGGHREDLLGANGENGDCAAPGCTNEATVSDFSFTVEVESVAAAEGSANGGNIGCPNGCTPIITFAATVALTDSSMQLVAQDGNFDFVVVFPAGSGGVGSPPPATYRFGLCLAILGGYVVQGAEGTGASVQLGERCVNIGATFGWPAPTGPETVVYPQGAGLPSPAPA